MKVYVTVWLLWEELIVVMSLVALLFLCSSVGFGDALKITFAPDYTSYAVRNEDGKALFAGDDIALFTNGQWHSSSNSISSDNRGTVARLHRLNISDAKGNDSTLGSIPPHNTALTITIYGPGVSRCVYRN